MALRESGQTWVGDAGLAAKLVGIVLLALFLTGWFDHGDRLELVRRIDRDAQPSAESATARALLAEFGVKLEDTEGDQPERLRASARAGRDGDQEAVVLVDLADGRTELVATREEIGWWALESDEHWAWVGLALMAAGTVSDLVRRRSSPPATPRSPAPGAASDPRP